MNSLSSKIESILFLSTRPVSFKKLAKLLEVKESEIVSSLEELQKQRNTEESGIHLIVANGAAELGTNPGHAEVLEELTKEELSSELTRPQLETLTVIAYRGPITKPEIEHIRGVNCSLIVRNLLMRGLIVEKDDSVRLQSIYSLSSEMLRFLGIHHVDELPDYKTLNGNEKINRMLDVLFTEDESL